MSTQVQDITRGSVLRMAVPVILAQAATAMTGVVDTAVMGRFGDKVDLAAVAVASVVFSFIYWSFGFLRMATTGLTAQARGAAKWDEAAAILQRAGMVALGLGLVLMAVFPLVSWFSLPLFGATDPVNDGAAAYMNARIWGAPAALMGFVVMGWLLGSGRTGALLVFQIVLNGVNAVLDAWFVAGLDWGPAGIGAGTAIAEWVALGYGLWLVRGGLKPVGGLFDRAGLSALLNANRDILIRTLALLFSFAWFVRSGAQQGTAHLAGNEVLLQFIAVSAFVLDGFAFIMEKEAGEAIGARNSRRLWRGFRLTSEFAVGAGAVFALVYLTLGDAVIRAVIADEEARSAALAYLPYCAAVPLIGVLAWQLDGLFIGATRGRDLRNAGVFAAVAYVAVDRLLAPWLGNTGVWLAFLTMYLFRVGGLAACLPGLVRDLRRPVTLP